MATRKHLAIRIPLTIVDKNTKIDDIPKLELQKKFNWKEVHLVGVSMKIECDCFLIVVQHDVLPETFEGQCCLECTLKEAEEQYPFLFSSDWKFAPRYVDF